MHRMFRSSPEKLLRHGRVKTADIRTSTVHWLILCNLTLPHSVAKHYWTITLN
jgi:hypothetical protein